MTARSYPIASYARLIGEHAEISRRVDRLVDAVDRQQATEARRALDMLAEVLIGHLQQEDRSIYPHLMAARDGTTANAARAARLRHERLAADWDGLIAKWPESRIAGDQRGFAIEAIALVDRLNARIDEENELLYPAALASGQLSLREPG